MPSYTKEQLQGAVKISTSNSETLRNLGLCDKGGSHKVLKKWLKKWNIDTSHFLTQSERTKRMIEDGRLSKKLTLKEVMIENSSYSRYHLKKRLYSEGINQPICEMCGQDENWNGRKMSLILDHINGIRNDHRLENLRIVCPNCNATLDTHCAKNLKTTKTKVKSKRKSPKSFQRKTKITWPDNETLAKLVWEKPRSTLAKEFGVTDKAIAKRCDKLGISQPPRGYWAKLRSKT